MFETAVQNFTSPVVLFFVLGLLAAFVRSDLTIPEPIAKAMSLYLMAAIGIKGGVAVAKSGIDATVLSALAAGIVAGFVLPLFAYGVLKTFGKLDRINAGAVAAHYGSISVVTFVTASQILTYQDREPGGYMVAVMAAMEAPAILSGLLLARGLGSQGGTQSFGTMMHEVLTNSSIVLLLGAFVIGMIAGPSGFEAVTPFFESGFKGILCLFLLDMGLSAGRGLRSGWRTLGPGTVGFGLYMPLVSASVAAALCVLLPIQHGDAALLLTLAASASYIAVPAAMRLALPQAKPSIYLTLSLGVTFPFNVILGIPIYIYLAGLATG